MGSGRGKSRRARISLRRKPRFVAQDSMEAHDNVYNFIDGRMPAWAEPDEVSRATKMPMNQAEEVLNELVRRGKMSKEYLATCSCGAVLFRGPTQAYENKRCSCGAEYTAYGYGYEDKSILASKKESVSQTVIYTRNEQWDDEVQEQLGAAAIRGALEAETVTF